MSERLRMAESGAQLLARIEGRQSLKDIEQHIFPEDGGPAQGDVVEFHGVEGSGKTEMLYHLLTHCILPKDSGGLEVEVVFVDTDYHFDMLRLVSILETRLTGAADENADGSESETEEAVRCCLRRLSVIHCSSSVQLLLTLHYLEGTICSRPSLCLLVIDSISAFYWMDRSSGGESLARQESNLRKCAELLNKLRRDYGIVVFATAHAVMRNYSSAAHGSSEPSGSTPSWKKNVMDFDKPYLCRTWQKILTHRLVFSKSEQSLEAVDQKQVFSVACSTVRTKGVKRCTFHVTEGGVQFIDEKLQK
ncbi:DNA repair protein XRCC2 [Astyanax mexicanus]|uniref:DNA repair protein XRCC2 n=2 Tax=Astyanax mexicanus TaxID=7994 RepID=A0A8B9H4A6_ASTMX|nr:DNA repair protein XRCC2 [Astyanax mexicanus]